MKQTFKWRSLAVVPVLVGLFFFAGLMNVNAQQSSTTIFGVTTANQLVRFSATTPGTITTIGTITGLQTGENILGIDFRPATGQLYALGSNSRLYTINLTTGAATLASTLSVTLSGTSFGVDFNPTVDRLRITSDAKQNLRVNVDTGAVTVDAMLNAPTGTAQDPTIGASAYTNSFSGATTTTLYNIDFFRDRLTIQNPPNDGTQVRVGELSPTAAPPVGNDITGALVGFDIGSTDGTAYASLTPTAGTSSSLYTINLQTGLATLVGTIGGGVTLRGIAVAFGTGTRGALNLLDFDGDRRADFAVRRPTNPNNSLNTVFIERPDRSASATLFGFNNGDDIFNPGDYDGDGRTDIAVFRNSTGTFFVRRSSDNIVISFRFGLPGDEPLARDYDGDGRTDFAVVRRTGGRLFWFINNSSNGVVRSVQFGLATDVAVPGDYDGDGSFDIAVFRGSGPNNSGPATFIVMRSSGGITFQQFGLGSDLVVPGDYDGDGRTDLAVVRTGSIYSWFILRSSSNTIQFDQLGTKPFLTVQNDYDGDGRTDIAVFDPSTGFFYIRRSSDGGLTQRKFGQAGDYPIANYDTH